MRFSARPAPPHPRAAKVSARPAFEDEAVQAEAGVWGRQPPGTMGVPPLWGYLPGSGRLGGRMRPRPEGHTGELRGGGAGRGGGRITVRGTPAPSRGTAPPGAVREDSRER
ncbi:hypothetical protein C4B68_22840 [Streptomyces dengpaensis]|uniref:Uncharacterized protein n=1 Tax=Streptomyces dengpaensis TaxID=2049881 RepID=A0ABM6SUF3_9ACTN|nr:hypothetical protein C4B68_22840 [Streptomyces dengpaensis]